MILKILFFFVFLIALVFQNALFAEAYTVRRLYGAYVYYYESLHEAFFSDAALAAASRDEPLELSLISDIVLNEPVIIDSAIHIRLVAEGGVRTIKRGSDNIDFPLFWVSADNSSLTLGKPYMGGELIIDGGYLNSPPTRSHAPLIAVSGRDSKLVMYAGVAIQNNYNHGHGAGRGLYQNGAGVFIRTARNDRERLAEFVMKGGIIRGNTGSGVMLAGFGLFTMEGGVIMNNTAQTTGGGLSVGNRASFRKTGGVIYGKDAPQGYRNIAIDGGGFPRIFGHAVAVALPDGLFQYRDDTVSENDFLSYTGAAIGAGRFGTDEKWSRNVRSGIDWHSRVIAVLIAAIICILFLFILGHTWKKLRNSPPVNEAADKDLVETFVNDLIAEMNLNLSLREKEILALLLSELSVKQIAHVLNLQYSGVTYHSNNLYKKLKIKSRKELYVKFSAAQAEKNDAMT